VNDQGQADALLFGLASLDDETARQLAQHNGTPAMRLEYALLQADRRLHAAEAAAQALAEAGGDRLDVDFAYDAAHLAWADAIEAGVAAYAREHAAARTGPDAGDLAAQRGPARLSGTSLLAAYLMDRGGGWEIGAWRDAVAGYCEAIQARATATAAQARAAGQEASEAAATAAKVRDTAARHGLAVTAELSRGFNPVTRTWDGAVADATVTVEGRFTPGDARAYVAAERHTHTVLRMVPMVRPGSVWGTGAASTGGHAGLHGGCVRMTKSGIAIAVARHLAQQGPPDESDGPAVSRGSAVNRSTAAAVAAAGFPYPPRPAGPDPDGAKPREPGSQRPGQQVPRRARGRHQ
jgi:hypothetical protein